MSGMAVLVTVVTVAQAMTQLFEKVRKGRTVTDAVDAGVNAKELADESGAGTGKSADVDHLFCKASVWCA